MENFTRFKNTDYLISNDGVVFSEQSLAILKPFDNNGYLVVDLFANAVRQRVPVHRMVAIAFISNPENKPFVNHIDGNKHNNNVENLEWCTASENSIHAIATGLSPIGSQKTLAKITEKDVLEIQALFEAGKADFEIAIQFGVTSGVISAIRLGKTWKHVSGKVFPPSGPNPVKKLNGDDIPTIRQMIRDGVNDADIGRLYKVARGTINQIRQGKTWINY